MAVEQVLKIRDLRIESVRGLVLVNNVSLELKRGEVLGLLGEGRHLASRTEDPEVQRDGAGRGRR